MQSIFEKCDKYNDQILKRSQFILQLRTSDLITNFINSDAVKLLNTEVLTVDQVLSEVERDEHF